MNTSKKIEIGQIYNSNSCGKYKVIQIISNRSITVEFLDTGYITTRRSDIVKSGAIKDRLYRAIYGVGYIGEGEYGSTTHSKIYGCWKGMLARCYCPKAQSRPKNRGYKECKVCDQWHNFQVFAEWYEKNYPKDGKEYDIDKDKRIDGNRVYSPSACTFLSHQENTEIAKAKDYFFVSPAGETIHVYNLRKFCVERGLMTSTMWKLFNGKRKNYKGWRKAADTQIQHLKLKRGVLA